MLRRLSRRSAWAARRRTSWPYRPKPTSSTLSGPPTRPVSRCCCSAAAATWWSPTTAFRGTVIYVGLRGISYAAADGRVDVTVAAGEDWDDVVAAAVAEGLAGLECLSGIPGRTGATPIQNVGAYGQEVAEVITTVRVFDRLTAQIRVVSNEGCGFAYRSSMFKRGGARALRGARRDVPAGQGLALHAGEVRRTGRRTRRADG